MVSWGIPGQPHASEGEDKMRKGTTYWLPLALLYGLSFPHTFLNAAEPVKTGKERDTLLYIRTVPPGAKVSINGKKMGTSNGLFPVQPGKGTILVELEGRKPDQRQVIIRANAITRLELSLEPRREPQGPRFLGRFPQGTVELVGITDFPPTEQSRWWKPDGADADLDPISAPDNRGASLTGQGPSSSISTISRRIPRRVSGKSNRTQTGMQPVFWTPRETSFEIAACSARNSARPLQPISALVSIPEHGKPWPYRRSISSVLRRSAATASRSPWSFTCPKLSASSCKTPLAFPTRAYDSYGQWKKRLLAVTRDGSEHVAWLGAMGDKGAAVFWQVPLSSIVELRLQIRPYTWVEFKNISPPTRTGNRHEGDFVRRNSGPKKTKMIP